MFHRFTKCARRRYTRLMMRTSAVFILLFVFLSRLKPAFFALGSLGKTSSPTLESAVYLSAKSYGVRPLEPGQKGKCWFHSQQPHEQDKVIFKRLGGEVGECSSAPVQDQAKLAYSEAQLCACKAPPASAFESHFLEIGANDGQYLSNSLFFEMQLRWTGLCIEGSPSTFEQLRINRPKCANFNALVGPISQARTFYTFISPASWETGVSCMKGTACAKSDKDAQQYAAENNLQLRTDEVQVIRLSDAFSMVALSKFSWLSIDVEGAEDIVVPTIDFTAIEADYISIEGTHLLARDYLLANGYRADFTVGPDTFFTPT